MIAKNFDFYQQTTEKYRNKVQQLTNGIYFFTATDWRNWRFFSATDCRNLHIFILSLFVILFYSGWMSKFAIFINERLTNFALNFNDQLTKSATFCHERLKKLVIAEMYSFYQCPIDKISDFLVRLIEEIQNFLLRVTTESCIFINEQSTNFTTHFNERLMKTIIFCCDWRQKLEIFGTTHWQNLRFLLRVKAEIYSFCVLKISVHFYYKEK